jgi:hypothetical protein
MHGLVGILRFIRVDVTISRLWISEVVAHPRRFKFSRQNSNHPRFRMKAGFDRSGLHLESMW